MMKKFSAQIALILAAVCLFSCGGKAPADNGLSLAGTWKYELNSEYRDIITEVIVDERVYVDIYYIFNEDGTGRTYASDGSFDRSFTYTFKNSVITITSDGYSFDQPCKLSADTLIIHDDEKNEDVKFIKQKTEEKQ